MITITMTECKSNGATFVSRHNTTDPAIAVARAVARAWGRGAYFVRDGGISVGTDPRQGSQYGQVMESARGGGSNAITGRIRICAE